MPSQQKKSALKADVKLMLHLPSKYNFLFSFVEVLWLWLKQLNKKDTLNEYLDLHAPGSLILIFIIN